MDRRQYLTALGGVAAGTAGVVAVHHAGDGGSGDDIGEESGPNQSQAGTGTGSGEGTGQADSPPAGERGTAGVPDEELNRGAPKDGIPAIVDPVFAPNWETEVAGEAVAGVELRPDDEVIGIERAGIARAYPLKLLRRHEVVNDRLGGPQLITYCPVCDAGLVTDRTVAGTTRTFGVSGYLYRANLVLYDEESESLWSQLGARAIQGPLTGTRLDRTGSAVTTWGDWQRAAPETSVLVPPPASNTVVGPVSFNYSLEFYQRRERITDRYPDYGPLGALEWTDTRLQRRTVVVGVSTDSASRAYAARDVQRADPINDIVGSLPVLVTTTSNGRPRVYLRRVEGQTLTAGVNEAGDLVAGGSRWSRLRGTALDGPYEGTRLPVAPGRGPLYWAAWLAFNPESTVYGLDS
ncbi:MAG: hypothetical protein J07HX64_02200 [halophilic archaeon J07HX64]|jgi:Protein of unknown function (DUF3179).|nr:MAG: hypothetical protein J07HX64_02200 [halophilic archaeon J07HX64]